MPSTNVWCHLLAICCVVPLGLDALAAQSRPAAATLDSKAVAALIEQARHTKSDALLVLQDGATVVDERFRGEDEPIEAMSVTKSIVALAFGTWVSPWLCCRSTVWWRCACGARQRRRRIGKRRA
ncbi:MAG: hypothetical protein AAF628_09240 [Planctomycetota bacterium]